MVMSLRSQWAPPAWLQPTSGTSFTGTFDEVFERFSFDKTPKRESSSVRFCPGGRPRQRSGDEHWPPRGLRQKTKLRGFIAKVSIANDFFEPRLVLEAIQI
jgi:hypothetical protein